MKTTESGGTRGLDAGKKLVGRKRHIVTDTQGFMVGAVIHAANVQDRDGGRGDDRGLDAVLGGDAWPRGAGP